MSSRGRPSRTICRNKACRIPRPSYSVHDLHLHGAESQTEQEVARRARVGALEGGEEEALGGGSMRGGRSKTEWIYRQEIEGGCSAGGNRLELELSSTAMYVVLASSRLARRAGFFSSLVNLDGSRAMRAATTLSPATPQLYCEQWWKCAHSVH